MRKLFELIGVIVTLIVCVVIAVPVLLTVIGVAVPVILLGIVIFLLLVLFALAIFGIFALATFWRMRYQLKHGHGVDFAYNGKRYHIYTTPKQSTAPRRDVTNDD